MRLSPADLPAEVVPFPVTAPYRTTPSPRPLDGPSLVLDGALPAALSRRGERLRDDPDGVLVRDPADPDDDGLAAALDHAFVLLRDARQVGGFPEADPTSQGSQERDPLALARAFGLGCADDLVVLRRRRGRATAELLAVSFPSGWAPRRRAGADLLALHAPVGDGERLRAASSALSEALLSKGPFRQHVWGLQANDRLDHDPSAPDAPGPADTPVARWWLRVETQTSIPLPHLDRALFLIRPHLRPLADLSGSERAVLADAVASMSPEVLAYKGLDAVQEKVLAHLGAGL